MNNNNFCTSILIGNKQITVNIKLLAKKSEYFRCLFFGCFKETSDPVIRINTEFPDITCQIIEALQNNDVSLHKNDPIYNLQAIIQENYFGIEPDLSVLERLDIPDEYFGQLINLINLFGEEYHLMRSIAYNIPANYDLSEYSDNFIKKIKLFMTENYLISANTKEIRIWNLENKSYTHQIDHYYDNIPENIFLTYDLEYLIYSVDRKIIIQNIDNPLEKNITNIHSFDFCHQFELVCGTIHGLNNYLAIFHSKTLHIIAMTKIEFLCEEVLKFSDDGKFIMIFESFNIYIYEINMPKIMDLRRSMVNNSSRDIIPIQNNTWYTGSPIRLLHIIAYGSIQIKTIYWGHDLHPRLTYLIPRYTLLSIAINNKYITIICRSNDSQYFIADDEYHIKTFSITTGESIFSKSKIYNEIKSCLFWNDFLIVYGNIFMIINMDGDQIYCDNIQIDFAFLVDDILFYRSKHQFYSFNLATKKISPENLDLPNDKIYHLAYSNRK